MSSSTIKSKQFPSKFGSKFVCRSAPSHPSSSSSPPWQSSIVICHEPLFFLRVTFSILLPFYISVHPRLYQNTIGSGMRRCAKEGDNKRNIIISKNKTKRKIKTLHVINSLHFYRLLSLQKIMCIFALMRIPVSTIYASLATCWCCLSYRALHYTYLFLISHRYEGLIRVNYGPPSPGAWRGKTGMKCESYE